MRPAFRAFVSLLLAVTLVFQAATPGYALLGIGDFTLKDEIELGKKFNVLIKSRLPLVEDPEVKLYVRSIVERLLAVAPPQPYSFEANVLLHNSVNAFASPGGYIFVHTGLLLAMEHESEVAGVLAHEMAHVTQRHIASRMEKMQAVSVLSLAGVLAGALMGGGNSKGAAMVGSMAAGQSAMLNYSRIDENEADQIGLQFLTAAGFRAEGMTGAFDKLRRKHWMSGTDLPAYLTTHPDIQERISEVAARVSTLPAKQRNLPENDATFNRVRTLVRARYADVAVAEQIFAKAPENDCLSQLGKAILLARQNRVAAAEAAFEKALKCDPRDQLVWREAGRFHYTKGDRVRAASMLQRAVTMNPRDYMALFYYARLLADSGDRARAFGYFEEVLRQLPEDAEVHQHYGRVLGEDRKLFKAYLHLAYGALYGNEKERVVSFRDQARAQVRTAEEQSELDRLEARYQERKAFW